MLAPLHISEISPPEVRGTLLVLEEFAIVSGIVIAFWITYGTRHITGDWSWRLPFLLQMVPALILGVGGHWQPLSPKRLMSRGRRAEALQSLASLRRLPADDPQVQLEHIDIQTEVTFYRQVSAEKHPKLQDGTQKSATKLEIVSWTVLFKMYCWRQHMWELDLCSSSSLSVCIK